MSTLAAYDPQGTDIEDTASSSDVALNTADSVQVVQDTLEPEPHVHLTPEGMPKVPPLGDGDELRAAPVVDLQAITRTAQVSEDSERTVSCDILRAKSRLMRGVMLIAQRFSLMTYLRRQPMWSARQRMVLNMKMICVPSPPLSESSFNKWVRHALYRLDDEWA